jgi:proteasome activator-like protein
LPDRIEGLPVAWDHSLSGFDQEIEPPSPDIPADAPAKQSVDPQRLLRIAGLTREVLEEARRIRPEPSAVGHLRDVHGQITKELKEALPAELYEELDELTPEIRNGTLEELALAHAEILGWLEGLFQGTQLAIQFQAAQAAHQALQDRMRRGLPTPDPDGPDSRYL